MAKDVTLTRLYLWELFTYTSIAIILSIFSFLALLLSVLKPSYPVPAHILPLHVYTPFSFHVLCLLGYLLTVQVDAAVWNHGAGVSGRKLSIHVGIHLQGSIHRGCEADWQLILRVAASLRVAVLMAMLLLVFICHLQIQWGVIQVRL